MHRHDDRLGLDGLLLRPGPGPPCGRATAVGNGAIGVSFQTLITLGWDSSSARLALSTVPRTTTTSSPSAASLAAWSALGATGIGG